METRQALMNRQNQIDSRQHIPEENQGNRVTYKSAHAEEVLLNANGRNDNISPDTSGYARLSDPRCLYLIH